MDIETWLFQNDMKSAEMAKILGVCRDVVWKIKRGETVTTETAEKVYFMTGGCVKPKSRAKGRPRKNP